MTTIYEGMTPGDRLELLTAGVDVLGCPITPFVDADGGWPLRCCMRDSAPLEELAIVAYSSFPWTSPYRTTGPIVMHTRACPGSAGDYPGQFDSRAQIVRAYGTDGPRTQTLVYDLSAHIPAGGGLSQRIDTILSDYRVEFVQAYNVLSGCYSFTARRREVTA